MKHFFKDISLIKAMDQNIELESLYIVCIISILAGLLTCVYVFLYDHTLAVYILTFVVVHLIILFFYERNWLRKLLPFGLIIFHTLMFIHLSFKFTLSDYNTTLYGLFILICSILILNKILLRAYLILFAIITLVSMYLNLSTMIQTMHLDYITSVLGTIILGTIFLGIIAIYKDTLVTKRKELVDYSIMDPLIDAYNIRYFHVYFDRLDFHKNHALALIDVDDFKTINDTYGHIIGDTILRKLVDYMNQVTRLSEVLFRYGGDELIMVFHDQSKEEARAVLERIAQNLSTQGIDIDGLKLYVTLSIGICDVSEGLGQKERLLKLVDQRMYEAKSLGKNNIVT